MEAPEIVTMVRDHGPLPEDDATLYAFSLPQNKRRAETGCYVVRCTRSPIPPFSFCSGCPIMFAYNLSCGDCLWPGISTVPFLCFAVLTYQDDQGSYRNIKGDTIITKVDEERDTLACYAKGCEGGPCCYCDRKTC